MSNKNTWEEDDIVEYYTQLTALQPPEVTITNILRDRLSGMGMLDIGVGAGRTTLYFAELVSQLFQNTFGGLLLSR